MNARRRSIVIALRTAAKATGGEVRYERDIDGDTLTCTISNAGRGSTIFEMLDEATQVVTTVHSQDFFFEASQLVFPGNVSPVTPQLRDRIIVKDAADREWVYKILDKDGQPRWRYMDAYRDFVRVFTKLVEEPQ